MGQRKLDSYSVNRFSYYEIQQVSGNKSLINDEDHFAYSRFCTF